MKNKYLLLFIIFYSLFNSQTNVVLNSTSPIVLSSFGNGTYNHTEFYHTVNGLTLELAKTQDNYNSKPIDFKINTRGGERPFFTINGYTGNIGIGTNNPQYKFTVEGICFSNEQIIQSYSPTLFLQRNTNDGGYTQGIQTRLFDGTDNWFFGNLHSDQWIVSKGNYSGILFKIGYNGNASLQGKFEAKEVKVTTTPTADFVFAEDYKLPTLEEVEKHINEKKHLPEIAPAIEMEKEGVNVGEFQIKLLQKIEELTLYQIQLNKEIKELKKENQMLNKNN